MTDLKLDDFLPYRLSVASNAVSDAIASTYQALFGLRIPEWRLIAVIAETSGMTPQALALATRMDKVTVSRAAAALAKRLEAKSLTPDGRALYDQVAPKALEMEARLFGGLGADERTQFRDLIARIEAAAGGLEG